MSPTRWLGENVVDGEVHFRIGRDGDRLVAEWCELCELRSDRSGEHTTFDVVEGADARTIAKVKTGLAAALVRHLHGGTSLHASAFSRNGSVVACVGPSGSGKSTIAAWMCGNAGYSLVADDILRIELTGERALAVPCERDHWLDPVAAGMLGVSSIEGEEKAPFQSSRIATEPAPLVALLSLAYRDQENVEIVRVRGQRLMELLVPCMVRFVLDEHEVQLAELVAIERLVQHAPLYEVRAPRDFDSLAAVAEALEKLS